VLIFYRLNLNRFIEGEIMPSFKCEDAGMKCNFKATAETRDKLMGKIVEHAREEHNMKNIPHDFMMKVKKAVKE
jgi:predicted small metal-binding protein